MQTFNKPTDEQAYSDWLAANPKGYVVNCASPKPRPSYLMLHVSTCKSISRVRPGYKGFTSGDYQKLCSVDRSELEAWARRVGGQLQPCGRCKP